MQLGHHGRAADGAPDMAHAAQHGHEQVLNALLEAEGRWVDVRWKCANNQPEMQAKLAAIRKMPTLWLQRVHAHGLGHQHG
jgi:hypothetical protein